MCPHHDDPTESEFFPSDHILSVCHLSLVACSLFPCAQLFFQPERRRQVEAGLAVCPEPSIPESVLNNYCWWEWRYWPLRKRHCGPSGFHRLFLHVAGLSCPATPFRFWAWNMAFGPISIRGTTSYTSIWGRRIWCGGRRRRETECVWFGEWFL